MEQILSIGAGGRLVATFDYGDSPDVLLFHHATQVAGPLSPLLKRLADIHKFRIIEIVRPGYGNSSSLSGRSIMDVASINIEIADLLGVNRFGLIGYSGGAPHALASASLSQKRCVGTVVAAGMAPLVESDFDFYVGMDDANIQEWMGSQKDIAKFESEIKQHAVQWSSYDFEKLKSIFNSGSKSPLSDAWIAEFAVNNKYSLQQGAEGILEDSLAFLKPWGFSVSTIQTSVQIWAAESDVIAPVGHSRWLHQNIEGSELHVLEGKDHNSVVEPAWESGIAWLRTSFDAAI